MVVGIFVVNCKDTTFGGWMDHKYFKKHKPNEMERVDPSFILRMACALYDFGEEMEGGSLKDLDLKTFYVITCREDEKLVVVILKPDKYLTRKKERLMNKLTDLLDEKASEMIKNAYNVEFGNYIKKRYEQVYKNHK